MKRQAKPRSKLKRRAKAKKPSNQAHVFLRSLPRVSEFPLSGIARALFEATGEQQQSLLARLREGQILASVKWPGTSRSEALPPALWLEVESRAFRVRFNKSGRWTSIPYYLSSTLIDRHTIVPRLRRDPPVQAEEIDEIARLLDSRKQRAEVIVTMGDARLFAEVHLGGISTIETRGRRPTERTEDLWIEIVRLLWPLEELPKQESFATDLLESWNRNPMHTPRRQSWVLKHLKKVWPLLSQDRSKTSNPT